MKITMVILRAQYDYTKVFISITNVLFSVQRQIREVIAEEFGEPVPDEYTGPAFYYYFFKYQKSFF